MNTETFEHDLENTLAGTLRPILPRREFVHALGSRLRGFQQTLRHAGENTWKDLLFIAAGLLSLGLLLALVGRLLSSLFRVNRA
jgi:hypothetical protein